MKSAAVYKAIREVVAPWAKSAGFGRARSGMLSYMRQVENTPSFETFWFQCSQSGWDAYTGSQFTLEFQESIDATPGGAGRRARFGRLLTGSEREQVRSLQNVVIRKLRKPPSTHWAHTMAESTRRWYFAGFDEVAVPYRESDDVWLRYADEADVTAWARFLVPLLPRLLSAFQALRGSATGGG